MTKPPNPAPRTRAKAKAVEWVPLAALLAIGRECKGWTLRKLERECGVSNALLSQIEHGHVKDPGFSTVVRICDALGIPMERAATAVRVPTSSILRYRQWREANGKSATPIAGRR